MVTFIFLVACLHKPPQVFPVPPPIMGEPPALELKQRDNECEILDVYPDAPVTVACYGHVISTTKALELSHCPDVRDYWQVRAQLSDGYRQADRAYCQAAYSAKWTEAEQLRRRAGVLEIGAAGCFVVGAIFGGAVAVATVRAVPQ